MDYELDGTEDYRVERVRSVEDGGGVVIGGEDVVFRDSVEGVQGGDFGAGENKFNGQRYVIYTAAGDK